MLLVNGPPEPGATTWYGSTITSEPTRASISGDSESVHSARRPTVSLSMEYSDGTEVVVCTGMPPGPVVIVVAESLFPAAERS